jgi:para-aminobenzoate synthetase
MPSLLIVDNHDSYTYNLVQAFDALTGARCDVVPVDRLRLEDAEGYDAVVISPGPGHPALLPEFAVCLELLRRRTRPILGVCLGHQGMIVAHGGEVDRTAPAHGVVERLHHDGTGLFDGIPQETPVVRYHSLAGTVLPEALRVTATGADGSLMGVAHETLPQWGVQFHPESILTAAGRDMLANFLTLAGAPVHAAPVPAPAAVEPPVSLEALRPYPGWIDPDAAAAALLPGRARAFWLDSADTRPWTGGRSVLGWLEEDEQSVAVGPAGVAGARESVPRGWFLARLRELEAETRDAPADGPPAIGGWVGVAGYETQEILPDTADGSPRDGFFLRVNRAVVWDHAARTVHYRADDPAAEADLHALLDTVPVPATAPEPEPMPGIAASHASFAQYERGFARLQEALRAGDTYEAVLTFPVDVRTDEDPLALYRALRRRNPAPYAAYLRHDDHVVLSTSPERMLRVTPDGVARVRPIKGTLPRSADPQADALRRWRLGSEDGFLRENLMIADLVRNDLGRVCRPGSVAVTQFLGVEAYATVFQLVTAVEGRLEEGVTAIDALRAVFPAGSMTGAPKRRTMELIREVEPHERGAYSGALGWFGPSGADFAVVIRTWAGADGAYRVGTGGALLIDSTVEAEYAEAMTKAAAVVPGLPLDAD